MNCRPNCGACCIAPSIHTPLPGMPNGKPANSRCLHLDESFACKLFNDPTRPALCDSFLAERETCGDNQQQALELIQNLELATLPFA